MRSPSGVAPFGDARPRPRGDQCGVELDLLGALGRVDDHRVGSAEAREPLDEAHPLARQQLGGARLQVVLDALDAADERLGVQFGRGLFDPHPVDPLGEVHRSPGGDHRLRRDAVPQVRGAADDVALDHRDLRRRDGPRGWRRCCPQGRPR
jgi:hypothetical protein